MLFVPQTRSKSPNVSGKIDRLNRNTPRDGSKVPSISEDWQIQLENTRAMIDKVIPLSKNEEVQKSPSQSSIAQKQTRPAWNSNRPLSTTRDAVIMGVKASEFGTKRGTQSLERELEIKNSRIKELEDVLIGACDAQTLSELRERVSVLVAANRLHEEELKSVRIALEESEKNVQILKNELELRSKDDLNSHNKILIQTLRDALVEASKEIDNLGSENEELRNSLEESRRQHNAQAIKQQFSTTYKCVYCQNAPAPSSTQQNFASVNFPSVPRSDPSNMTPKDSSFLSPPQSPPLLHPFYYQQKQEQNQTFTAAVEHPGSNSLVIPQSALLSRTAHPPHHHRDQLKVVVTHQQQQQQQQPHLKKKKVSRNASTVLDSSSLDSSSSASLDDSDDDSSDSDGSAIPVPLSSRSSHLHKQQQKNHLQQQMKQLQQIQQLTSVLTSKTSKNNNSNSASSNRLLKKPSPTSSTSSNKQNKEKNRKSVSTQLVLFSPVRVQSAPPRPTPLSSLASTAPPVSPLLVNASPRRPPINAYSHASLASKNSHAYSKNDDESSSHFGDSSASSSLDDEERMRLVKKQRRLLLRKQQEAVSLQNTDHVADKRSSKRKPDSTVGGDVKQQSTQKTEKSFLSLQYGNMKNEKKNDISKPKQSVNYYSSDTESETTLKGVDADLMKSLSREALKLHKQRLSASATISSSSSTSLPLSSSRQSNQHQLVPAVNSGVSLHMVEKSFAPSSHQVSVRSRGSLSSLIQKSSDLMATSHQRQEQKQAIRSYHTRPVSTSKTPTVHEVDSSDDDDINDFHLRRQALNTLSRSDYTVVKPSSSSSSTINSKDTLKSLSQVSEALQQKYAAMRKPLPQP